MVIPAIGFQPQSQKFELHTKQIVPCESILLRRFNLNDHSIRFPILTQKLELYTK